MMMQTIPFSEIQWSLPSEGDPFPLCGRRQFCLYQQIPFSFLPVCVLFLWIFLGTSFECSLVSSLNNEWNKIFNTHFILVWESTILKNYLLAPWLHSQKWGWQGVGGDPSVSDWAFTQKRLVEWANKKGKTMSTLTPGHRGSRFEFISVLSYKNQACTAEFEDCCDWPPFFFFFPDPTCLTSSLI